MNLYSLLSNPVFFVFLIPIVAIVMAGIVKIVKLLIQHHERITMIEMGMHPDFPPENPPPGKRSAGDAPDRG